MGGLSTHAVEVVPFVMEPHPNADKLSIVRVFDGYTCVVNTEQWQGVTKAAYIPPDSIVPNTNDYSFLAGHLRIRVKRLRGVYSMGLLMPAPEGSEIGDDVTEQMGVTHYEPPEKGQSGSAFRGPSAPPPEGFRPKFDLDSLRRYGRMFEPGEKVVATEKLHGCQGRFTYQDGAFHVGSKREWKFLGEDNLWWKLLAADAQLRDFLTCFPGTTVYGECYGQVQELKYGLSGVRLAVFDVFDHGVWWEWDRIRDEIPFTVPELYRGPFDLAALLALAEGQSTVPGANHVREGCVVRCIPDRTHDKLGRCHLKVVGNGYLEKA